MDRSLSDPKVSIVVATCRLGGLDVLTEMARTQTFRDFEIILVDYFFFERRHLRAALAERSGLPLERFAHVPPRTGCWQLAPSSGQAYNTGFSLASGQLVCPSGDFQLQYPQWLEDHWRVFEDSGGHATLAGDFTAITYAHCAYTPDCPADYVMSVFDPIFTVDSFLAQVVQSRVVYATNRGAFVDVDGCLRPDAYNATQNESIPRDVLNALNGFDEAFDGSRGYQDQDVGYRLKTYGHSVKFVPSLKPALHIWTHDDRANPDRSSTIGGASWMPSSQRNADLLASRVALGEHYPIRALNGGWDVGIRRTPDEIVALASRVHPPHAFPFSQLEPTWVRDMFAPEPAAGKPTCMVDFEDIGP